MGSMQGGRRSLEAARTNDGIEAFEIVQGEIGHITFPDKEYPDFVILSDPDLAHTPAPGPAP
jgi:hypothetical protein